MVLHLACGSAAISAPARKLRSIRIEVASTPRNITSHQLSSTLLSMIPTPREHYLTSSVTRAPLRVGIAVERLDRVPAFAAKIIADIQTTNFAEIRLVLHIHSQQSTATPPLLYRLYLGLDERMRPSNDPLAVVDCRHML